MPAIKRNIDHRQQHTHTACLSKAAKSFHLQQDDCSACDKLPKQLDDIVEGESPKRFKRPKMASDIIAR